MFKANRISVLISGICALILSMGIARYSFTPMIPSMQEQVGMTESLSGWLAGWNYMGYLTGLFIVWLVSNLRAKDFFYRYGLLVAVVATLAMAASDHVLVWYVSRFFAGIATAAGFMLGTGLIVNWLRNNGYRSELGIHFSGIGLGIVVAAVIVDVTNIGSMFETNWRLQWVVLAAVGFILLLPSMFMLPIPKDDEIENSRGEALGVGEVKPPSETWLWLLQIAYFCAGFSNTVNVTFTSLITELQPLDGWGAKMWLVVGIAATPAPFIWDRVARKIGRLDALRLAFLINVVGNITLALTFSMTTTILAAILFGFTFMGIVSLTLSTVASRYGNKATQVMARLTLGYCVAQILSPVMSGIVAEKTGSFAIPLYIVSGIILIGLVCLLLMKKHRA
ncbi:YbfB/YjiJ family MFS transporter [Kangiella sp. HZ709]|uniref:YbfB/YjiJ family MFS transporter n=1 Tax=Kangiella sp. HZ709 TaxID=2666328 RepID=UPI001D0DB4BB|nr:YbfB/YjiJ family MFS transporter [Kangiella sp. HZ709]